MRHQPSQPERTPAEPAPEPTPDYESPAIAWEEDFEPAGQATGCSYIEGDCFDGAYA